MKTLISLLFFLLLLTSCTSSRMISLGGKASSTGTEVAQKALDLYGLLSKQADLDKSQQDKLKVLTHPDPASMKLPDTKVNDFSAQLEPRINAYQSLLATYRAFTLLTDDKLGDRTREALSALQSSYNAVAKLPDLPASVSSRLPEVAGLFTRAIQAKKIKAHNQALFELTQLYLALWKEDQKLWNDYLDRIYDDFATGLNTVDSKRYDAGKIDALTKTPYSDPSTIILMYRLDKRDEIIQQKNEIKSQLELFAKALEALNQTHAEIAIDKSSIPDIVDTLNTIDNLLKQK